MLSSVVWTNPGRDSASTTCALYKSVYEGLLSYSKYYHIHSSINNPGGTVTYVIDVLTKLDFC